MGLDDRHLDFRLSVRVTDTRVLVSTVVQVKSGFGRFYWSFVRHVHPVVVASMLRRTPVAGTSHGSSIAFGE